MIKAKHGDQRVNQTLVGRKSWWISCLVKDREEVKVTPTSLTRQYGGT